MNRHARVLEKIKSFPLGLWFFSRFICWKAPYFQSIHPTFLKLRAGEGEAKIRNRRNVRNHLGTVHAIAMANLCELVAGTTLEVTLPDTHRWIPKGMTIKYLSKATTDVTARTLIDVANWPDAGSVPVLVEVRDRSGQIVVTADIEMYVSRRKS